MTKLDTSRRRSLDPYRPYIEHLLERLPRLSKAALAAQGDIELHEVGGQALPDGDFLTVNFPNPEEPGALGHLTAEVHADIALATDLDGDRLAVAVPDDEGDLQVLMGNQTGMLLADLLLRETLAPENGSGEAARKALYPDRSFVTPMSA